MFFFLVYELGPNETLFIFWICQILPILLHTFLLVGLNCLAYGGYPAYFRALYLVLLNLCMKFSVCLVNLKLDFFKTVTCCFEVYHSELVLGDIAQLHSLLV